MTPRPEKGDVDVGHKRRPKNPEVVDLARPSEVRYWTKHLDVTLREAVGEIGDRLPLRQR